MKNEELIAGNRERVTGNGSGTSDILSAVEDTLDKKIVKRNLRAEYRTCRRSFDAQRTHKHESSPRFVKIEVANRFIFSQITSLETHLRSLTVSINKEAA